MNSKLITAMQLIGTGDRLQAKQLLAEIVKQEPQNSEAWFYLSSCVDVREQKVYCLNKVLAINPNHKAAYDALQSLDTLIQPVPTIAVPPQRQSTNALSIVSLIFGILTWVIAVFIACPVSLLDFNNKNSNGFVLVLFLSILGVGWLITLIVGIVGKSQIRKSTLQGGEGIAKAGIIMGSIGVGIILVFCCIISLLPVIYL